MERLQRVVAFLLLAVLVGGSAVAFARTQVLKSRPWTITRTDFKQAGAFSPAAGGSHATARFSISTRRAGRVEIVIVDAAGQVVRTLLPEQRRPKGLIGLAWNGKTDGGRMAPDGTYRVRVRLPDDDRRTITILDDIVLDQTPPTVKATAPATADIVPGLPGTAGEVQVRLAASEPVRAGLIVTSILPDSSSRTVFRELGAPLLNDTTLTWHGDAGRRRATQPQGRPVGSGSFIVGWQATDAAGNRVVAPADVSPGQLAPATVARVLGVAVNRDGTVQSARPEVALQRSTVEGGQLVIEEGAQAQGAPDGLTLPPSSTPSLSILRGTTGVWTAWNVQAVRGGAKALLVVPTLDWQAASPFDGAGDGFPDVPPQPQSIDRPFLGLPERTVIPFARRIRHAQDRLAPLGAVTDVDLERNGIPRGTRIVALASPDGIWTAGLLARLTAFRDGGGVVLEVGKAPATTAALDGDMLTVGPAGAFPLAGRRVTHNVEAARRALYARPARARARRATTTATSTTTTTATTTTATP